MIQNCRDDEIYDRDYDIIQNNDLNEEKNIALRIYEHQKSKYLNLLDSKNKVQEKIKVMKEKEKEILELIKLNNEKTQDYKQQIKQIKKEKLKKKRNQIKILKKYNKNHEKLYGALKFNDTIDKIEGWAYFDLTQNIKKNLYVSWQVRKDGVKPKNSYIEKDLLIKHFPDKLLESLEKCCKFPFEIE